MKKYDYKENARQYDKQVKEYNSYVHDVIFGMVYEYVRPGERILDLGIGTGLASINFSKIGLKVYGLDISDEMLNVCRTKSFTEELRKHDLTETKLPYDDRSFNHIICSGVLHFLSDPENVFSEAARVLTDGGMFAFTIAPGSTAADFTKQMTSWKVPIYKHSPEYIKRLLDKNGMKLLKEQRLLLKGEDKVDYNMLFSVMTAKYK